MRSEEMSGITVEEGSGITVEFITDEQTHFKPQQLGASQSFTSLKIDTH